MEDRAAKIGMVFFLATEAMFFAGLISAYWVLRAQVSPWPPLGQPRLPVLMTGLNTGILLLSGITVWQTGRALWLGLTGLGGVLFLSIQGYEWYRLIHFGLTTVKNIYGGIFYIVVGAHALHVVAALVVLFIVLFKVVQGSYSEDRTTGVTLCRMYWTFVVGVWPILYALVYF